MLWECAYSEKVSGVRCVALGKSICALRMGRHFADPQQEQSIGLCLIVPLSQIGLQERFRVAAKCALN